MSRRILGEDVVTASLRNAPIQALEPIAVRPQHINLPAIHVARIHMVYAMFHRAWPLGSEEGRAMAEHLFGPEPVAELPQCRFGYPRGWLHTFCRSGV